MLNGRMKSHQTIPAFLCVLAILTVARLFNNKEDYIPKAVRVLVKDEAINNAKYVFQKSAKSVVYIDSYSSDPKLKGATKVDSGHQKRRNLAALPTRQTVLDRKVGKGDSSIVPLGSGSGYIWDDAGHVVTNNHVVHGATEIEISVLSKKNQDKENSKLYPTSIFGRDPSVGKSEEYHWKVVKAKVVGTDPDSDIAVLQIDVTKLDGMYPIKKGDDKKVDTGDECFAIGNPFGLDHTLTRGIVSGKGRVFTSENGVPMTDLIQTDASINPGNSGGPLLNRLGEIIGMNTMILSKSGSSSGIGFAIPISRISKIADILIKKGKVSRPKFGVKFGLELQAYFGISKGGLVYDVSGPADKAGLRPTTMNVDGSVELGDIITKINNIEINSDLDAYEIIDGCKRGDVLNITVERWEKGKFVDKKLKLKLE